MTAIKIAIVVLVRGETSVLNAIVDIHITQLGAHVL